MTELEWIILIDISLQGTPYRKEQFSDEILAEIKADKSKFDQTVSIADTKKLVDAYIKKRGDWDIQFKIWAKECDAQRKEMRASDKEDRREFNKIMRDHDKEYKRSGVEARIQKARKERHDKTFDAFEKTLENSSEENHQPIDEQELNEIFKQFEADLSPEEIEYYKRVKEALAPRVETDLESLPRYYPWKTEQEYIARSAAKLQEALDWEKKHGRERE